MKQHAIELPCQSWGTIPNLVYYELGKEIGSPCDTIAITNLPEAEQANIIIQCNPNPNNGTFMLSWQPDLEGQLLIRNAVGQLIFQSNISSGWRSLQVELPIHNTGIFYWQIVRGIQVFGTGKISVLP